MAVVRLKLSDRQTMLDAIDALFNSGSIQIRSGTIPTNPTVAPADGALLATLTLNADSMAAAAGAEGAACTKAFNGTPLSVAAVATGTAAYARVLDSGSVCRLLLDITATSGGGGIELNSTAIQSGATVQVTSLNLSLAAG